MQQVGKEWFKPGSSHALTSMAHLNVYWKKEFRLVCKEMQILALQESKHTHTHTCTHSQTRDRQDEWYAREKKKLEKFFSFKLWEKKRKMDKTKGKATWKESMWVGEIGHQIGINSIKSGD